MATAQPVRSAAMPKLRQAIKHSARDPDAHRSLNVTGTGGQLDVCSNLDLDCGSGYAGFARRRPHESLDARLQQKKLKDELISDSEIEYLIKEKLRREQYAVECMFRNADPNRCGRVHRNALLRILYSICGHIRFEQFHRLLERLGLEDKPTVDFADFKASLASPDSPQQWRPPTADSSCDFGTAGPQVGRYSAKPVSVAHAFAMLRQRAAQPGFDLHEVLPPACFEPDGVVLKPQLWQALVLLRIPLAPSDVDKFWDRFDLQCTGAVSTVQLSTLLGLNNSTARAGGELLLRPPSRLARSKTAPALGTARKSAARAAAASAEAQKTDDDDDAAERRLEQRKADSDEKAPAESTSKPATPPQTASAKGDFKYLRRYQLLRKNRPDFDHFVDSLHYTFDEPHNALLVTFRHFDSGQTGCVSPTEMRQVLQGFGFPTASGADFDQFVLRFGLRSGVQGAVSYAELFAKLQARGCSSLLGRYLASDRSPLTIDDAHLAASGGQNLSPYQMELQLLRFLHRDYLQLHCGFVREDPDKTGIVAEETFRACLRRVLKSEPPGAQLSSVLCQLPRSRSGGVQYRPFLEMFHIAPNTWTKQPPCLQLEQPQETPMECERALQEKKPPAAEATAAKTTAESLERKSKQHSQKDKQSAAAPTARQQQRSLLHLSQLAGAALTEHFHRVDKIYKQMDRRNTGRMSRAQFWAMLNALGLRLTEEEIGALWATLDTSADGQWSYRQMLRHFMTAGLQERALEKLRASRSWCRGDTLDPSVLKLRQLKLQQQCRASDEAPKPPDAPQQQQQKQQTATASELDALIERCRPEIVRHWEELKMSLRRLDPQGTACLQRVQFLALAKEFQLPLSSDEADGLARGFEKRSNGRFNYMEFLKRFVSKPAKPITQTEELSRTVTDKRQGGRIRIAEIMDKIREKLLFEWKSLLLAFRKFDMEKTGYLSIYELRKIVHRCGYTLSEDDLFLLLTEFDLDFDGKINYQEFVMQLLDVAESC